MKEPLAASEVRKLLRAVLASGTLSFTGHAREEMAKDRLTEVDVVNVLRGGSPQPGEFENQSWRYRVTTLRIVAVVAFRSETHAVVVTAWRLKK